MAVISFNQSRRVTALVDEIVEYIVNADRVKEVMDDSGQGLSREDAIGYLLRNGECSVVEVISSSVDEVVMVHDSEIIVN